MRRITLVFFMLFAALSAHVPTAWAWEIRTIPLPVRVPNDLIVGRSRCGALTWVLTDARRLVSIQVEPPTVGVVSLTGLPPDDNPWGLACVADNTFWTLASPRALVRMDSRGRALERLVLTVPRIALFAVADRLLFEEMPPRVAAPVFQSSAPGLLDVRPWPGLLGRGAERREDALKKNLAHCGLANHGWMPCWFADETSVVLSNGSAARTVDVAALRAPVASPHGTVWDAALVADDSVWVLTAAGAGQPGGRRLLHFDSAGREVDRVDLAMPARLIVAAAVDRVVLLASDGPLITVNAR